MHIYIHRESFTFEVGLPSVPPAAVHDTYIDPYIHTCIHIYIHTCIHTYTHIHKYIHTQRVVYLWGMASTCIFCRGTSSIHT